MLRTWLIPWGIHLDSPVVLLDAVNADVRLDTFNGRRIGTTLVGGDLLGHAVQVDGALHNAPGCDLISLGESIENPRYRRRGQPRGRGTSTGPPL